LVKRRWRKRRYPFDLLGVAQFAYCNIECTYCYLQTQDPASFADGFNPYPVLPAIRGIIEAGQLAPRSLVDWGGGEPTIYKEFDELLARLTAHGCSHWIHTNGTRLPKPLLNGLSSKRIHVLCSLDAGTRETYRLIKKKDFFDRVWRNLERYVDLGCHVVAKYIMTEENCERRELELFIDRVKRTGIRSIVIDIDYNFPDPSPRVLAGLAMLKRMAFDRRIHAGCGFTGAKFTPEMNVEGKIDAAGAGRARGGIGALRDGMMRAAITADRVSERLGRMLRR
jgi:sulfatase maturation enzyme AslB (radical SAM superfamily)